MKIDDLNPEIVGYKDFILNIPKEHCKEVNFDVSKISTNKNNPCIWWQELKDSHEIKTNYYYAKPLIEKYNITDYEIYFKPIKHKIKVKTKIRKGKYGARIVEVDRINPYISNENYSRAYLDNNIGVLGHWYYKTENSKYWIKGDEIN